MVIAVEDRIS